MLSFFSSTSLISNLISFQLSATILKMLNRGSSVWKYHIVRNIHMISNLKFYLIPVGQAQTIYPAFTIDLHFLCSDKRNYYKLCGTLPKYSKVCSWRNIIVDILLCCSMTANYRKHILQYSSLMRDFT